MNDELIKNILVDYLHNTRYAKGTYEGLKTFLIWLLEDDICPIVAKVNRILEENGQSTEWVLSMHYASSNLCICKGSGKVPRISKFVSMENKDNA